MINESLQKLGLSDFNSGTSTGFNDTDSQSYAESYSPVDGRLIGAVSKTSEAEYEAVLSAAQEAKALWRKIPAPKRGEIIRQYGDVLRTHKEDLGKLVSYEVGKSVQEGFGEVQEMIDICDFAVGLSRQLYGLTMHSERPEHRMYEQWHPLGIVGIISAFNFPVAVWSWNAMIALVCGNVCVWKPSKKGILSAVACQNLFKQVLRDNNVPEGVSCLITGDYTLGEQMTNDERMPLISATGSTRMGKIVASTVGKRLGKTLLELGGNNAIIITPNSDLDVVLIGAIFGAVGTCGQRCTSTRRLIIHSTIYEEVKEKLVNAYKQIKIGNPLDESNHIGPLIDTDAVGQYLTAIDRVQTEGGKMLVDGGVLEGDDYVGGCYVKPCIAEVAYDADIVRTETFAPILYVHQYDDLHEAIDMQNSVPQGLSSAIMTNNLQ